MLEEFARVVAGVEFGVGRFPVVSNVTGEVVVGGELCEVGYWVEHVRRTVRFADGIRALRAQGVGSFLELGPDGVLSAMASECLADGEQAEAPGVAVPTLRRGRPEVRSLLDALAAVWVQGAEVDWEKPFEGAGARRVGLPRYAFQRERFWLHSSGQAGDPAAVGQSAAGHPLLGAAVALAGTESWIFTSRLTLEDHPWLADHQVMGNALLPATAYLDIALHAGSQAGCEHVQELTLHAPLALRAGEAVQLQVTLNEPDDGGSRSFGLYSRAERATGDEPRGGEEWARNAEGTLTPTDGKTAELAAEAMPELGGAWPPVGTEPVALDDVYRRLAERDLEYGPAFRGLRAVWRRGEELFAEVTAPDQAQDQAGLYGIHPALLDAALHALAAGSLFDGEGERGTVLLPFSWSGAALYQNGAGTLRVRIVAESSEGDTAAVSLVVADGEGRPVAAVNRLALREMSAERVTSAAAQDRDSLFCTAWIPLVAEAAASSGELVALGAADSAADVALAAALHGAGVECGVQADLADLGRAVDRGRVASRAGAGRLSGRARYRSRRPRSGRRGCAAAAGCRAGMARRTDGSTGRGWSS